MFGYFRHFFFGWTTHLKNKNAQTVKDSFENNLINSKKPNLFETDVVEIIIVIFFKIFQTIVILNSILETNI